MHDTQFPRNTKNFHQIKLKNWIDICLDDLKISSIKFYNCMESGKENDLKEALWIIKFAFIRWGAQDHDFYILFAPTNWSVTKKKADCVWACLRAQSCLILQAPIDCSPTGSSVHGKNTGGGLPFPPPGDLSNPKSNQCLLHLLYWEVDSLPLSHLGRPKRQIGWS